MRLFAALALLAPLAPPAAAEPLTAAARDKLDDGVMLHDAGDYAGAIGAFREGYQLQPHRDFLYAIAQSERKRGNCKAAIEAYRAFLAEKPPAREARRAETNLQRCEANLAAEKAATKAAERDPEPEPAPPPEPEPESPPPSRPPAPPRAEPPARDKPDVQPESKLDWVATALYASGGMALALGGSLLVMSEGSADQANAAATLDEFDEKRRAASSLRAYGMASIGLGAALLTGGVIRTVMRSRSRHAVSAAPVAGGAVLSLGGEF